MRFLNLLSVQISILRFTKDELPCNIANSYLGRNSGSGRARRSLWSLRSRSGAAEVLRAIRTRTMAGHAHVVRRRRRRAVGSADARVVLRSSPAQADARVANRVALHLVDGHLGSVTVHELNKAATLAGGDLHVGDFTKALEERSELILGHISREATDENRGVVGIGELVHLRSRVVAAVRREALNTPPHLLLRHASHHLAATLVRRAAKPLVTTVSILDIFL